MSADLVIYAIVAAGLVLWLRSVLGTRHGDERERPNPLIPTQGDAGAPKTARDAMAFAGAEAGQAQEGFQDLARLSSGRFSIEGRAAEEGLMAIARADRSLDIKKFLENAQEAFVFIVEAFASGDRDTLRNLLGDAVYRAFAAALDERERKGETVATEIHSIRRTEVLGAGLDERGRAAHVTLRFTADETCVIRDAEGNILSGNPDRVTEMVDIWTFGRDLRSRDPRWLVVETRDGPAEDHKTPLPETLA